MKRNKNFDKILIDGAGEKVILSLGRLLAVFGITIVAEEPADVKLHLVAETEFSRKARICAGREGEITAVMAAEAEGTWAHYPDFQAPGKAVLFHQFHDILAGSLVRSAVEDALENYQQIESQLSGYIAQNLSQILSPTEHLTLWNTLGHPRQGVVRLSREWMGKDFFLLGKKS